MHPWIAAGLRSFAAQALDESRNLRWRVAIATLHSGSPHTVDALTRARKLTGTVVSSVAKVPSRAIASLNAATSLTQVFE
jgi:hypothetical protein